MQRCSHSLSTASALRSIFFPTSNLTCVSTFLAPSYAPDAPLPPYQPRRQFNNIAQAPYRQASRAFAPPARDGDLSTGGTSRPASSSTAVAAELRRFGVQKERRPKDEEIAFRSVRLVGGIDGTGKGSEVVAVAATLRRLDRSKYFLVQVAAGSANEDGIPPCKVIPRQQYFDYEQQRGKLGGGGGGGGGGKKPAKTAKQLELSWGIGPNDLEHRLKKAVDFLAKGKKLEIMLAHKKRGKSTPPDECAALVRNIKERITNLGHREGKPMEGKIGGMVTMYFEPKAQS